MRLNKIKHFRNTTVNPMRNSPMHKICTTKLVILWKYCYVMWNLFTVGSLQFPNDSTVASLEANQNQIFFKKS